MRIGLVKQEWILCVSLSYWDSPKRKSTIVFIFADIAPKTFEINDNDRDSTSAFFSPIQLIANMNAKLLMAVRILLSSQNA
jgi:hypothetical protein